MQIIDTTGVTEKIIVTLTLRGEMSPSKVTKAVQQYIDDGWSISDTQPASSYCDVTLMRTIRKEIINLRSLANEIDSCCANCRHFDGSCMLKNNREVRDTIWSDVCDSHGRIRKEDPNGKS